MLLFHIALPLSLMAVVAGTWLYVWASNIEGEGTGFAKLIGILVIIFSIISTGCLSYFSFRVWQQGGMYSMMDKGSMGEKMSAPAATAKKK